VIVAEGDGALLMHLGALVTLGAVAPKNLIVLLVQNGAHAASGGQALTNPSLDLAELARASAIKRATNVATTAAFADALRAAVSQDGPQFIALAAQPDLEVVTPPFTLDPIVTKHRFTAAIGAPRYVPTLFDGGHLARD
jgi:thiamine pyrophosphate-dependent acetolactate synthase large subunit-like protein